MHVVVKGRQPRACRARLYFSSALLTLPSPAVYFGPGASLGGPNEIPLQKYRWEAMKVRVTASATASVIESSVIIWYEMSGDW